MRITYPKKVSSAYYFNLMKKIGTDSSHLLLYTCPIFALLDVVKMLAQRHASIKMYICKIKLHIQKKLQCIKNALILDSNHWKERRPILGFRYRV